MTRKELLSKIPSIFVGFHSIENRHQKWFTIRIIGCLFPDELDALRKLFYVSFVSFSVSDSLVEISCSDLGDDDEYSESYDDEDYVEHFCDD